MSCSKRHVILSEKQRVEFSLLLFGSTPIQHVRWVRSAVVFSLLLEDIRGFAATLASCVGTLFDNFWHKVGATKNIPFVARCISSWHCRLTARKTWFCFLCGACMDVCMDLLQRPASQEDRRLFIGHWCSYFVPKMCTGICSCPLWHQKWALVWRQ